MLKFKTYHYALKQDPTPESVDQILIHSSSLVGFRVVVKHLQDLPAQYLLATSIKRIHDRLVYC